jgi:hypothetical protein
MSFTAGGRTNVERKDDKAHVESFFPSPPRLHYFCSSCLPTEAGHPWGRRLIRYVAAIVRQKKGCRRLGAALVPDICFARMKLKDLAGYVFSLRADLPNP